MEKLIKLILTKKGDLVIPSTKDFKYKITESKIVDLPEIIVVNEADDIDLYLSTHREIDKYFEKQDEGKLFSKTPNKANAYLASKYPVILLHKEGKHDSVHAVQFYNISFAIMPLQDKD